MTETIPETITTITSLVREFRSWDKLRGLPFAKVIGRLLPVFQAQFEGSPMPSSQPLSVHLEISSRCNCRCKMCHQWTWTSNLQNLNLDLVTEQILEVLEHLAMIGVETVTISGGDPMTNPDFAKIIAHAKLLGLAVGILTDGQALTPQFAESINKYASWIRFSIDGADKETYECIRGIPGGFDRACQSLSFFDPATRQILIGINYVVQRDNYTALEDIVAFGQRMSVDIVLFKLAHGQGKYLLQPQEVIQLQRMLIDSRDRIPSDFTNVQQFQKLVCEQSTTQDISEGVPIRSFYTRAGTKCFAPFLFSVINSRGDVYPCDYLYFDTRPEDRYASERAKYRLGNIHTRSLDVLLSSPKFYRIADAVFRIDPVHNIRECGSCTRFYMVNSFATALYTIYRKLRGFYSHDKVHTLFSQNSFDFHQHTDGRCWL
jgi:MoaA/NifB/PqqE/SkfB family radical SAM enzyme